MRHRCPQILGVLGWATGAPCRGTSAAAWGWGQPPGGPVSHRLPNPPPPAWEVLANGGPQDEAGGEDFLRPSPPPSQHFGSGIISTL